MSDQPTILGICDDRNTCDCCGKTGLKKTVALDIDGETVFFGTTCAAWAITGRRSRSGGKVIAHNAAGVSFARRLISEGTPARKVAARVFDRFGLCCEIRGNVLSFAFTEVTI